MGKWITAKRLEGVRDDYKQENEDRAEILQAGDTLVLIVADGVGGRANGGAAAQKTVDIVRKAVGGERPNDEAQVWTERLAGIDRMLQRDKNTGETTAVIAAVTSNGFGRLDKIVGASAGDSGAWLIMEDRVENLTQRQIGKPYLGWGAALPIPFECDWNEGTLLLGTDGLFKYADADRIADAARHPDLEHAAQQLLELVRLPSGKFQDDVSLLLCRHERKPNADTNAPSLLKSVKKLLNWGRR